MFLKMKTKLRLLKVNSKLRLLKVNSKLRLLKMKSRLKMHSKFMFLKRNVNILKDPLISMFLRLDK
jgi:hypothetical protein